MPLKAKMAPSKMKPKRKMRFLVHIPHFQAVFFVQILRGCISWEIMSLSLCWVRFFHCEAKAKESKQWLGAPSGVKRVPQYMNYIWSASSWCCFYFKPTHFFFLGGGQVYLGNATVLGNDHVYCRYVYIHPFYIHIYYIHIICSRWWISNLYQHTTFS